MGNNIINTASSRTAYPGAKALAVALAIAAALLALFNFRRKQ